MDHIRIDQVRNKIAKTSVGPDAVRIGPSASDSPMAEFRSVARQHH